MKSAHKIGLIILLLVIGALSGCVGPTPQPSPPPPEDLVSVAMLANTISADVGEVSTSVSGVAEKRVIVFEEAHDSRAGQIEIAIMLNRLHDKGLKFIALEGALATGRPLDSSWFNRLPDTNETKGAKQEVAVRLLKEGEINCAEFITLVYPDIEVWGIEKEEEYEIVLSDDASISTVFYLMAIAEQSLSQDQIRKANQLIEQEKYGEYIDFVINSSHWTKEMYEQLGNTTSIEETSSILDEIERKANRVGAEIDVETEADFQELKKFYRTASKRSDTMIANALDLCEKSPDAPIALITGAGHTSKVSELLKGNYVAYAIITPDSLSLINDTSELNSSAYDRKLESLSVDGSGMLGSFLDNRPETLVNQRKPPTVLHRIPVRSKSESYLAASIIAHAAYLDDDPPFGLEDELSTLEYVKVDINSFEVEDDEVSYSANVMTENGQLRTIYVRTVQVRAHEEKTIEELLKEAREDVKKGEEKTELVEVSRGVISKFATDRKDIATPIKGKV